MLYAGWCSSKIQYSFQSSSRDCLGLDTVRICKTISSIGEESTLHNKIPVGTGTCFKVSKYFSSPFLFLIQKILLAAVDKHEHWKYFNFFQICMKLFRFLINTLMYLYSPLENRFERLLFLYWVIKHELNTGSR